MRALLAFMAGLLLWGLATPGRAQSFPPANGTHVVDAANLLDPAAEQALDGKLAAFEKQTGRQFVVATIADLQGYPIDDYGYRLGRTWGVGHKDKNDGVLLIVAPKDRKVRIEVGYGLEPVLTDAYSSAIINSAIVPRFKAGDYPGGINAGADAIIQQLQLPPDEAAKRLQAAEQEQAQPQRGGIPFVLIFWVFILIFLVLPSIFGGRHGRRFGAAPIILWGPGDWGGGRGGFGGGWSGGSGGGFGGFSGGGGSFGGGGASGGW